MSIIFAGGGYCLCAIVWESIEWHRVIRRMINSEVVILMRTFGLRGYSQRLHAIPKVTRGTTMAPKCLSGLPTNSPRSPVSELNCSLQTHFEWFLLLVSSEA